MALAFGPWAFGSRPYFWNAVLAALLLGAAALGFFGAQIRNPACTIRNLGYIAVAYLVTYMWIGVANSRFVFDPAHRLFEERRAFMALLPSTVDARTSLPFAISLTAMLSTVALAASLSTECRWRRRFLAAMAWTGVSVIGGGLLLKTGWFAPLNLYLTRRPWVSGDIFGPFDYHGNAGTFINLSIPAIAFQAARARTDRKRSFWLASLCLSYLAAFANTSRAALAISLSMFPLLLWIVHHGWKVPQPRVLAAERPRRLPLAIFGLTLLMTCALLILGGSKAVRRMGDLRSDVSVPWYPRFLQNQTAWEMAQQRPLYGAGVGSYKLLVGFSKIGGTFFGPHYAPGEIYTVLSNAHDDYLQTLVEWGYLGTAGWVVLVGATCAALWKTFRGKPVHRTTAACVSVALGAVYVHAAVDCPLQIPALQLYAATYMGLGLGALRSPRFG